MAAMLKRGDSDMTEGSIWRQLLKFSMPMAAGLLFQQMYNTVDSIVVGRFIGKEALAAVGSTGSIINTLVGICAGLSTGATVVISQCYGAHDNETLHDAVHTTMVMTLIMCVLATAAGVFAVPAMLRLMDTPDDVFYQANEYLTIYFSGLSGLLIYNMGSGILRAIGDSRRPLYFLCFSAVVNVALDLLFVIRFSMGIAGVAYATIISQFLSSLLVLYVLTRTDAPYKVIWGRLSIKPYMLKRILGIGFPAAIQQGLTAFSNVFVQSYINSFGSACMAGWSSYSKIDTYAMIPAQSIGLASTTFVGQNYGAGKLRRAHRGVVESIIIAVSLTAIVIALLLIFAKPLVSLFSDDAEVISYGAQFIALMSPFYLAFVFNQIFAGALRGIGQSRTPMVIMLSSFVLFRQAYLYINKLLGGGFLRVAFGYPLGWMLCCTLLYVFYRKSMLFRSRDDADALRDSTGEEQ